MPMPPGAFNRLHNNMSSPVAANLPRASLGDARTTRDRRIVSALIGVFVVGALWLVSLNVAESSRKSDAKVAMAKTFAVVHRRQSEFRTLNGRFATWTELKAAGATLGPRQSVNGSNADASHWFISLRDQLAGVICDRTGELMDEDSYERAPVCRDAP
jgi:hypothetical protein